MSAEKCGPITGFVLPSPVVDKAEFDPELAWSDRSKHLLRRIRHREPDYQPSTIKSMYGKAYRMGLIDEQD
jgi:hypothetical protein